MANSILKGPFRGLNPQGKLRFCLAMRVPLLDLSEQYQALAGPIRQQIDEVLQTQRFILGPKVEQFESALCDYTGAKFAIGVSSGTDALLAVLMALGDWTGRRHHHHAVFIFCHRRLHRPCRRNSALCRYRSRNLQYFSQQLSGLSSRKIADKPMAC